MGLFDEQVARKPNMYPWTEDFIEKFWAGFWTPKEFDFNSDFSQFKSEMSEQEKRMVVKTLSAIGQVEIAVKRFWAQLGDKFPHPAMYDLGYTMAFSEVIHNKAYEKLLDRLQLGKAFEENLQEPSLSGRVNYLRKYLNKAFEDNRKQQIYSLILFTLFVENVSLFSQFYVILHLNKYKNILKDTAQQVQYTKNEETLHAQIGIKLINTLKSEYPELFDEELEKRINEEIDSAFDAECNIIDWMVGDYEHENLSAKILKEFVAKRINDSMIQIGYKAPFIIDDETVDRTLWFDEILLGDAMTDFFHAKPIEYSKKNKVFDETDLF